MPSSLYWLAVGAFCIGTETFMIAPLLPSVAAELGVSVAAAGQLVTVYALTYALASPVLSTALGNRDRKTLLIAALAAFGSFNLLAAAAQSLLQLMAAQVLLACAAGLFMPAANSVAAMIVAPERRGRAIAVVIGGLSVSLALGVPLGSLVGAVANWRATFVLIAAVCALGVIGLWRGLPRELPRGTATLAERLAMARRPEVLLALAVTFIWAIGVFSFYTFVAPFLTKGIGLDAALVPLVLFVFGIAGWFGNMVGGRMTDRNGPARTLSAALLVLGLNYLAFAAAASIGPSVAAVAIAGGGFIVGGVAGWSFHPAQTARLVQLARESAIVALSLNQSVLYLGTAVGAALGAYTIAHGAASDLAWVAALCQFAALATLALALRVAGRRATPVLQPGE